ncbi:MAG: cupin domain-containing protein [Hyphomicrobiales bacterium]|nr:cupin domain-containing protein [Hyphomicrobiales bacterium]
MPDAARRSLLDGGWRRLDFAPFRPGIAAHWIERGGDDAPSLAVLKYEPGARAPRHRHRGLETILMLAGAQSDENGTYAAGDLAINAAGTEHSVASADGCIALLHWALPVLFLDEG